MKLCLNSMSSSDIVPRQICHCLTRQTQLRRKLKNVRGYCVAYLVVIQRRSATGIKYSQSTISAAFSSGRPLIPYSPTPPTTSPVNVIIFKNGDLISIDNRRLRAHQTACMPISCMLRNEPEFLPVDQLGRFSCLMGCKVITSDLTVSQLTENVPQNAELFLVCELQALNWEMTVFMRTRAQSDVYLEQVETNNQTLHGAPSIVHTPLSPIR
jgi:hypothetical protein